jgi:hypothetical protein
MKTDDPFLHEYTKWRHLDILYNRLIDATPAFLDLEYEDVIFSALDHLSEHVDKMIEISPTTMLGLLAYSDFLADDFLHDEAYKAIDSISIAVVTFASAMKNVLSELDIQTLYPNIDESKLTPETFIEHFPNINREYLCRYIR